MSTAFLGRFHFLKVCYSAPYSLSLSFFFFGCVACRILVLWPDMKSVPLSGELQSLNYWTTREVPGHLTLRFPGFYFDLSFTSYSVPLWLRPGGSVLRVHGADLLFRTHYRLSCTHFFGLGKISSFSCRSLMDMQHFPMNTFWLFWQLSFSFIGANSMQLLWL